MGLLTPGHWHNTHWPQNHWHDNHWQEYGVAVPGERHFLTVKPTEHEHELTATLTGPAHVVTPFQEYEHGLIPLIE